MDCLPETIGKKITKNHNFTKNVINLSSMVKKTPHFFDHFISLSIIYSN